MALDTAWNAVEVQVHPNIPHAQMNKDFIIEDFHSKLFGYVGSQR